MYQALQTIVFESEGNGDSFKELLDVLTWRLIGYYDESLKKYISISAHDLDEIFRFVHMCRDKCDDDQKAKLKNTLKNFEWNKIINMLVTKPVIKSSEIAYQRFPSLEKYDENTFDLFIELIKDYASKSTLKRLSNLKSTLFNQDEYYNNAKFIYSMMAEYKDVVNNIDYTDEIGEKIENDRFEHVLKIKKLIKLISNDEIYLKEFMSYVTTPPGYAMAILVAVMSVKINKNTELFEKILNKLGKRKVFVNVDKIVSVMIKCFNYMIFKIIFDADAKTIKLVWSKISEIKIRNNISRAIIHVIHFYLSSMLAELQVTEPLEHKNMNEFDDYIQKNIFAKLYSPRNYSPYFNLAKLISTTSAKKLDIDKMFDDYCDKFSIPESVANYYYRLVNKIL